MLQSINGNHAQTRRERKPKAPQKKNRGYNRSHPKHTYHTSFLHGLRRLFLFTNRLHWSWEYLFHFTRARNWREGVYLFDIVLIFLLGGRQLSTSSASSASTPAMTSGPGFPFSRTNWRRIDVQHWSFEHILFPFCKHQPARIWRSPNSFVIRSGRWSLSNDANV